MTVRFSRLLRSFGIDSWFNEVWYGKHPLSAALLPLSQLYRAVIYVRRWAYRAGLFATQRAPVPVIVVGNLTTGGTGKTPLVIWLAGYLKSLGYQPGVIARGYGGRARHWPQQVRSDSDPATVGDEAIVIARRARCPIAVGPQRAAAAVALVEHGGCDIVISDDGLQHYGMARDIEIIVIDGVRRLGNGRCLPAGPLRETPARLREADLIVSNGVAGRGEFAMRYIASHAVAVLDSRHAAPLDTFSGPVHAVAGIGNPDSFFSLLRGKGLQIIAHAFPDHHPFSAEDLDFGDDLPILMTEKDAVKCAAIAPPSDKGKLWMVPVTAELPEVFASRIKMLLGRKSDGQTTS